MDQPKWLGTQNCETTSMHNNKNAYIYALHSYGLGAIINESGESCFGILCFFIYFL